jgi:hypothetical protein
MVEKNKQQEHPHSCCLTEKSYYCKAKNDPIGPEPKKSELSADDDSKNKEEDSRRCHLRCLSADENFRDGPGPPRRRGYKLPLSPVCSIGVVMRLPTSANSLVLCIMIKLWSFCFPTWHPRLPRATSADQFETDIATVDSPATLQRLSAPLSWCFAGTRMCFAPWIPTTNRSSSPVFLKIYNPLRLSNSSAFFASVFHAL